MEITDERELMTPREVADMFRVDSKTVTRWAKTGKIPRKAIVYTLGGYRRFRRAEIVELEEQARRERRDG
jgi:excisionase family DNA binding protein